MKGCGLGRRKQSRGPAGEADQHPVAAEARELSGHDGCPRTLTSTALLHRLSLLPATSDQYPPLPPCPSLSDRTSLTLPPSQPACRTASHAIPRLSLSLTSRPAIPPPIPSSTELQAVSCCLMHTTLHQSRVCTGPQKHRQR